MEWGNDDEVIRFSEIKTVWEDSSFKETEHKKTAPTNKQNADSFKGIEKR